MFIQRSGRKLVPLLATLLLGTVALEATAQTNRAPVISGKPRTQVVVNTRYTFQPIASDPDGNTLTYAIANRPAWLVFSTRTGRLTAIPTAQNVGVYRNIIVSASDGRLSSSLPAFSITVVAATTPPPTTGMLSERYPGDVGIAADAAVIFHDPYEDATTSTLAGRYSEIANSRGVSMVSDKPAKSRGARSVRLTAGASAEATHLFRGFGTGYDEVYLRYYTKYVGADFAHSGLWFGGYNPSLSYPWPRAGQKPTGSDRFSFGFEAQPNGLMDMYTYWMKMRSWKTNPAAGDYYGNIFINDSNLRIPKDQWTCFEVHLKLNPNPASGQDAVFELWENDQLVRRYDNTGPFGFWTSDKFCPADSAANSCAPYRPSNPAQVLLDQQWRNTTALKFNHIWPQNYNNSGRDSSLLFDDLVVARSRVGCLR
jgi:hypothetical protein